MTSKDRNVNSLFYFTGDSPPFPQPSRPFACYDTKSGSALTVPPGPVTRGSPRARHRHLRPRLQPLPGHRQPGARPEALGRRPSKGLTVRWYRDKFTGTTMDRPGFNRLLADVQAGKVARVVVWRLDRLGRTAKGLTALFEDLLRPRGRPGQPEGGPGPGDAGGPADGQRAGERGGVRDGGAGRADHGRPGGGAGGGQAVGRFGEGPAAEGDGGAGGDDAAAEGGGGGGVGDRADDGVEPADDLPGAGDGGGFGDPAAEPAETEAAEGSRDRGGWPGWCVGELV